MSYRVGGGSRGGGDYEEHDHYERSRSRAGVREYEHQDVDVRVRERERERDRVPAFMREDVRRTEAGPMVLRARDVETVERPRRRSPSMTRVRTDMRIVERRRSPSPPPRREVEREDVRIRTVDRVRSPSRVRTRVVERERSPSPIPVRTRFVERGRSPSPVYDRERIRIIERERERIPSPSPSPPPPAPKPAPPEIIKGPTIEREVITHYRDIDHGVIHVREPSPIPAPPPPRPRKMERDTEIDIYTSRRETEVDIRRSQSRARGRSPSVERRRPAPKHYHDDEVLVRSDRGYLEVDIDHHHHHVTGDSRRRARSAAPVASPAYEDDEGDYITSRINERGRMGEALHGATRDWAIVDVPPGTERVRMDGAGGGAAEVTWSKYSGVRRAQFLPDGTPASSRRPSEKVSMPEPPVGRERERERERDTRVSVQIFDERERERERDPPPAKKEKKSDMWTEITKDLITRDALEEMGYEYEETEFFFYILQYLRYEDVLELVKLSDSIRRQRKDRVREIEWEREYRDDWDRDYRPSHRHRDYEREVETEVVFDNRPPVRGYLR